MSKLLIFAVAVVLVPVFQTHAPKYVKGDIVRLATPTIGDPLPDSRVIAVAGDRLHIDASGIAVNGEAVPNVSAELLRQFDKPWEQIVPAGHYFVIAERHDTAGTVRYHGLIPASNIVQKVSK